jgi:RNA polymerase sigma-70 factor (ECF subfamily)
VAAGDRAAFAGLVDRHQASLFRYARLLTGNPADAEDILQETFLAVWKAAKGFRGESGVRTWLHTIARNTAYHHRERVARALEEAVDLAPLARMAGWGEDPETLAMLAQNSALLCSALNALPEEEREVVALRDIEGFSGEEVARMTGATLAAMKSRLHRARLRLAGLLRLKGGLA